MWTVRFLNGFICLAAFLVIAACAGPGPTPDETTAPTAPVAISPAVTPALAAGPTLANALVATTPGVPVANTGMDRPVAAPGDYLIGPQDLLRIEVFGVADLKREVRVNSSGQIALPLIGLVQAAGLTGEQLAADIAARLAKDYLQNPQVTVFIVEFTSQRVTVTGAVKTPNVFPLKGRTTLLQVIAAAGGPTSVADSHSVRILRAEPGGVRKVLQYDWRAIRDGDAPDPDVQGEDVVQVDTSGVKEVAKEVIEFVIPFRYFMY